MSLGKFSTVRFALLSFTILYFPGTFGLAYSPLNSANLGFSPKVTLTMLYYVEERQMTLFIIGLVQLAYFFSASFVKVKQVTPTGLPLSSLAAAAAVAAAAAPTHT